MKATMIFSFLVSLTILLPGGARAFDQDDVTSRCTWLAYNYAQTARQIVSSGSDQRSEANLRQQRDELLHCLIVDQTDSLQTLLNASGSQAGRDLAFPQDLAYLVWPSENLITLSSDPGADSGAGSDQVMWSVFCRGYTATDNSATDNSATDNMMLRE